MNLLGIRILGVLIGLVSIITLIGSSLVLLENNQKLLS